MKNYSIITGRLFSLQTILQGTAKGGGVEAGFPRCNEGVWGDTPIKKEVVQCIRHI